MDCSSPYAMARLTELQGPLRRRLRQRSRRRPARHRHPRRRACSTRTTIWPRAWPTCSAASRLGAERRRRQDGGDQQHHRPRGRRARPARSSRCRSASSGSSTGCSTARSASRGEESAGASFLRRDGSAWTTDKDGLIPCLLAAEMTARGGADPGRALPGPRGALRRSGLPARRRRRHAGGEGGAGARSRRTHVSADRAGRRADPRRADRRAGQRRADRRLKVVAENGWFAARPRAPRTSTRSTPRASSAPSTSSGSSTRRSHRAGRAGGARPNGRRIGTPSIAQPPRWSPSARGRPGAPLARYLIVTVLSRPSSKWGLPPSRSVSGQNRTHFPGLENWNELTCDSPPSRTAVVSKVEVSTNEAASRCS